MAKSTQLYDEFGGKLYPFSLTSLVLDASGKILESRIQALERLLDWFELDSERNLIKANHGIYSVGPLTAGGKATDREFPNAVSLLQKLRDVLLEELQDGEALVYDAEKNMWVNRMIEGSGGGAGEAVLESDIKADVAVGFVSKGKTLPKGMTLTQVLQQIFSQAVTSSKPSMSLSGYPASATEVGESVSLDLDTAYTDGKFMNTKDGTIDAGCARLATVYTLDGTAISIPHTIETTAPKVHTVKVSQQYGASTAVVTSVAGEVIDIHIPAGTVTAEASFVVGYRAFWGYMTDAEAENLTSGLVRGLEHGDTIINPALNTITLLNAENIIPAGQDLIIAVPDGYQLGEVTDKTTAQPIKFESPKTMSVQCGGSVSQTYKVYRYDNYNDDAPMYITKITIVKEA